MVRTYVEGRTSLFNSGVERAVFVVRTNASLDAYPQRARNVLLGYSQRRRMQLPLKVGVGGQRLSQILRAESNSSNDDIQMERRENPRHGVAKKPS